MIERLGVQHVQVEEILSFSDEEFARVEPAYGLVFLFKYTPGLVSEGSPLSEDQVPADLFFARQVVTNACATQALLSLLFNATDKIEIGPKLRAFRDFVQDFPADLKGDSIGSDELIREVHNSFARPEPFVVEDSSAAAASSSREDVFHFVAYVPFKDAIYELDGLRSGPIRLASLDPGQPWLPVARKHIEARIARYTTAETLFNLMALTCDRRVVLAKAIAQAQEVQDEATARALQDELVAETEKRRAWAEENMRRKHNYIPFIVAALNLLAKRHRLRLLVRAAQSRAEAKKMKE
jgi:ubiquitin carboxyl-terminal hydrolase L5